MQFFVARNSTGWQALLYSTLNNVRPDKQRRCHQTAWVVHSANMLRLLRSKHVPLVLVVFSTDRTIAAAIAAVKDLISVREGKKELTWRSMKTGPTRANSGQLGPYISLLSF